MGGFITICFIVRARIWVGKDVDWNVLKSKVCPWVNLQPAKLHPRNFLSFVNLGDDDDLLPSWTPIILRTSNPISHHMAIVFCALYSIRLVKILYKILKSQINTTPSNLLLTSYNIIVPHDMPPTDAHIATLRQKLNIARIAHAVLFIQGSQCNC